MPFDQNSFVLFSGSSHPHLAQEIANHLGVSLGKVELTTFPDGEISVHIQENVRGRDVFLIQSVALDPNTYLMELLVMIDALKRASAHSIVAVLPYFAYARQDRKDKPRVPITAKLVANLIETAGASRVLTMDLHADQVQGFFDIPLDNLYARPALVQTIEELNLDNLVVVAPDSGSVKVAKSYADQLGVHFAIVDKRRINAQDVEMTTVIGEVEGHDVLITDDMTSTGSTLIKAAAICKEKGAKRICCALSHCLLVDGAAQRLATSPIEQLLVSNSIPQDPSKCPQQMEVVTVAPLFAEAIRCILTARSISSLFHIEHKQESPQISVV